MATADALPECRVHIKCLQDLTQGIEHLQIGKGTARLVPTAVRVEVDMSYGSVDTKANLGWEVHRIRVHDINEIGIVDTQANGVGGVLMVRTSWILKTRMFCLKLRATSAIMSRPCEIE